MTWQQMLEKAAGLVQQAQKLLAEAGDAITDEQRGEVDGWLTEAEGLRADAEKLRGDDNRDERMKALQAQLETTHGRNGRSMPMAPELDPDGFKDWADYLVAVKRGVDPRLVSIDAVMSGEESKALSGLSGADAGFLIPDQQYGQMMEIGAEDSIVRPRAFLMPMGTRSILYPKLNQVQTPAEGESAFFGGVALEWFEDDKDLDEQDIKFQMGELVAHGLGGWVPVANSLIANSAVTLGAFIPRLFAGAANWATDYNCLRGNGVGKPLGVLNADATIWINRNTATTFKFVDSVTMLARMLTSSWSRAVWVMNQLVIPQLYQMQDAANQNIWLPNAAGPGPGMLLGIPIVFTEKLPALGTKGDVMLCDFGHYALGDRELPTVASSIHERFRKNQTTFRITLYLDGQPMLDDPIPLSGNVTTVSPFVGLDVPAS